MSFEALPFIEWHGTIGFIFIGEHDFEREREVRDRERKRLRAKYKIETGNEPLDSRSPQYPSWKGLKAQTHSGSISFPPFFEAKFVLRFLSRRPGDARTENLSFCIRKCRQSESECGIKVIGSELCGIPTRLAMMRWAWPCTQARQLQRRLDLWGAPPPEGIQTNPARKRAEALNREPTEDPLHLQECEGGISLGCF